MEQRRAHIEQLRNNNVRRIHTDLQRIAKREREFAQQLFDEIIPVRNLKKMAPFTFTWIEDEDEKVSTAPAPAPAPQSEL